MITSFKAKALLLLGALQLSGLLALGFFAYSQSRDSLERLTLDKLEVTMEQVSNDLTAYVRAEARMALLLAQMPPIQTLFQAQSTSTAPSAVQLGNAIGQLESIFRSSIATHPQCLELIYMDNSGQEVVKIRATDQGPQAYRGASLSNRSDAGYFTQAAGLDSSQVYISALMLSDGSGPVPFFWVASPAFDAQGTRLGVVALHIDTAYLLTKIRSPLPQGRAYLVDQRGVLFYRSDGGATLNNLDELHPRLASLLSSGLDSAPYVACEFEDGHASNMYCMHGLKKVAYDPENPENFWAIVFDAPPKEVFAPADELRDRFLIWGSVVIAISLGLTFFLSQRVVVNPVLLLEKAARRIAGGDLRPPLPPHGVRRDEIGQLYASFSTMVEKLRQATEHLEEEIQTRTGELQASETQLERQNLELQRLNTYKSHLLSVVSHELKTPLTSLDGFSRTVNQVFLTDDFLAQFNNEAKDTLVKVRHRVGVMGKNAVRLTRLVNDLLDFSRIDRGLGLEINQTLVDLLPVIETEVEACREMGMKKNLSVQFHGPTGGRSLWATADADRIGQVLNNLLSNALKFTDSGAGIHVEAGFTGDFLECRVQDSGEGLEPEALERIFELFEQSGNQISRNQGTGIGLAISKYIVERHGGYIRAESAGLGQGSAFIFGIPRHEGEEQSAQMKDELFAASTDGPQTAEDKG